MVVCLCIFLLSACTDLGANDYGVSALCNEDAVREAVFFYQFEHNASSLQQSAKAYDGLNAHWVNEDPSGGRNGRATP